MKANSPGANADLPAGRQTMSPAMAQMRGYPRYLFERVRPHLGQRVWEIGLGYGLYTEWLLETGRTVLGSDIDPQCLEAVRERFADHPRLTTAQIDLADHASISRGKSFRADSVLCLNVLEHIEYDEAALRWLGESVAAGATLALVVPAHPRLFGEMDAEAGHFRRYTRSSLVRVLRAAGWHVVGASYLNLLGAAGWWYHNRLRRGAGLDDPAVNAQMRRADHWLPRIAALTDPLCGRGAGLSVMAIARHDPGSVTSRRSQDRS